MRRSRKLSMVVLLVLAAAQPTFGESPSRPPPRPLAPGSYAVVRSTLESTDVSTAYARSLYADVRGIVRGYLADDPRDEMSFFRDRQSRQDFAGYGAHLLDLRCEIRRVSSKLVLSVSISNHETAKSLLSFETTALFFDPGAAVLALAEMFPGAFAGHVVRLHAPRRSPRGFHASGGDLYLYDVRYSYKLLDGYPWAGIGLRTGLGDLRQDLRRTEDVPRIVMRRLRRFRVRRTLGTALMVAGAAVFAPFTLLAQGQMPASSDTADFDPKVVTTVCIVVLGAGAAALATGYIEGRIDPSPRLIESLNECCREE